MDDDAPAKTTLLRNGAIYNPAHPAASAMLVRGETVAWIGTEDAAAAHADAADETVDLRGALVTPAFVDAHVHATATGLNLTGLDLTAASSAADLLDRLAAHARALPADAVVLGARWDETAWSDRSLPTTRQLDNAAGGRAVYLARVDVHSALVSAALLALAPEARIAPGYGSGPESGDEPGPLTREAHHAVREAALASVTPAQREAAQRATLRHAAELGLGALHECGGPQISGEDDFTALLALAARTPGPYVFGYWGETDPAKARALGAVGAGGDLFIDGAIGSHTACLREAYADAAETGLGHADADGHAGAAYLTDRQIGAFLIQCAEAAVQPGFHVIGDRGLDLLAAGLDLAADALGDGGVRGLHTRAEHAEMLDARHIATLGRYGVVVSAQPGFDAAWGGPDGMYARRLGPDRARSMNPLAALDAAGVVLAFGSDSPVIPLGPWQAVRDAVHHRTASSRLAPQAAFAAHTSGGWRALHPAASGGPGESGARGVPGDETGVLSIGAPATYAVWEAADADSGGQAADERTGVRVLSRRADLPELDVDAGLPRCLRTAVRGRAVYDLLRS